MNALRELERYTLERFRPPVKQTVSEWADANRVLVSESSAEPGSWRTDRAPYQREIMDSFTQPGVWQIVIMASAQVGKALTLDTPIPTWGGWKTMGTVQRGDIVFDEDGLPCRVTAVSPVWEDRPCREVVFSDGSRITADELHEWSVIVEGQRKVLETRAIADGLKRGEKYTVNGCKYFGTEQRTIIDIHQVDNRPVKCISVDSTHHVFLVGKNFIPTHNSEIELNMMGCAIDNDPGPMLYIQPTDKVAEDYSKRRIQPMINGCPTLREKVVKERSRDAANTILMKTFPGGSLAIIGANSPADLSSKPVRYIFMDETDRFPASAGTEGDPQELAERRTETFRHNRKIIKTSTPTIKGRSRIETDYMNGTQEEWHTECPHCHTFSFIKFVNIKFEKDEFKNEHGDVDYRVRSAAWECPHCKQLIPEHVAKRLPAKWVAHNPQALDNGIRSFRLNAFMSPWSDWKDICRKFLKAHNDPEKLKTFQNTILGESWEVRTHNGMEDALYKRREHYDAEVPTGVLVMTMGIDTQDNRLEYEVVGWDRHSQSWGIAKGIIPGRADAPGVWEEVDYLLDKEWSLANGMKMKILATFIDSGGHFTSEIYKECAKRQTKRIWPIKGQGGEGKQYCTPMTRSGGKNDAAKFMIGVDDGKAGIMYEVGIEEPGPNYMHFPVDYRRGYDMEYFRGLLSERMVIHRKGGKNVVAWEKTHERNEPLDCRNYARAAYRYFNWHFDELERTINGEDEAIIVTKKEAEKKKTRHVVSRGIKV